MDSVGVILCNYLLENSASFITTFLSAFLGFGSALLVESLKARREKKQKQEELLSALHRELEAVLETIDAHNDNESYINPYTIPVWKCAKESGSLLCLDGHKNFLPIIDAFSSVEEANLIEMKCFELLMAQPCQAPVLYSILRRNRSSLREKVNESVEILKEVHCHA